MMIKVSYKQMKRIEKVLTFFINIRLSLSNHYWLQELFDLIVPKRWRNVFYCPYYYMVISEEYCPTSLQSKLELIHKYVRCPLSEVEGILLGFAITADDYYYVILTSSGSEKWVTCVERIKDGN